MLRSLTGVAPGLSWCVLVLSAAHPLSPWNRQALVSLRADLKLHVLMETGLGDKLEKAAGGFMVEHEAAAVRQEQTNMEKMDKLIQLLLGKSDEDFATFLKMLQATNNGTWACQLEEKAEQFSHREAGMCVEWSGPVTLQCPLCACVCKCVMTPWDTCLTPLLCN